MRRAGFIAGSLVLALLLAIIFMGALLAVADEQTLPSELAVHEIPSELLPIYQAAAARCEGLDWTVLAAIHKVETNFGTGQATSSKGAQGPMQFMPATFRSYGVDGDGDDIPMINNVVDAVFSAGNLLCVHGAGDPAHLADAIWSYNHSDAYVDEVLTLATSYQVVSFVGKAGDSSPSLFLTNPRIILSAEAREDVEAGLIDPRLLSVMEVLSRRHPLVITVFKTGHSMRTNSGSISNHYYGRAADISFVDGAPVSASNYSARQLVLELAAIEGSFHPTEIGHPFFDVEIVGGFTDRDHRNHVHVGYDQ